MQIRSRDQSQRRNSGIESIVNNSSITLSCITLFLSLYIYISFSPPCSFLFFLCVTWLSRRRCIDSSASIRSTIYAATVLPVSFFFLPFSSSFFGAASKTPAHKPPGDGIHRAGRRGTTRLFSNLSRVRGDAACGYQRKVDNCFLLFRGR